MGRLLSLLALAGIVALAAAAPATTAPADTVLAMATCGGAKQYTFLFWPKGHPAIASVKFPKFATPHVEAYAGSSKKYPNSAFAASVAANGKGGMAKTCKQATPTGNLNFRATAAPARATALVCLFKAPPILHILKLDAGGFALEAEDTPGTLAMEAVLKAGGSKLLYDPTLCRLAPAPR